MSNQCTTTASLLPNGFVDRPWIGSSYDQNQILVLGESWYGDWGSEHNSDQGYVAAYLDGKISDGMYTRMANACKATREVFWHQIAFTNFVIWTGPNRKDRPTRAMYMSATGRLEALLEKHTPRGVWILGIEQSQYSAPVVRRAGIKFEVAPHPTGYGVSNKALGETWELLRSQIATPP